MAKKDIGETLHNQRDNVLKLLSYATAMQKQNLQREKKVREEQIPLYDEEMQKLNELDEALQPQLWAEQFERVKNLQLKLGLTDEIIAQYQHDLIQQGSDEPQHLAS